MALAAFTGCLVLVAALAYALWDRQRTQATSHLAARLQGLAREPSTDLGPATSLLREDVYSSIAALNDVLKRLRQTDDLQRLLVHAGIKARPGEVVLWMALVGAAIGLVVFLLKSSVVWGAAGFATGPLLVLRWLKKKRRERRGAITAQLPEALDMIRSSLQAGHSLAQALEAVAEECPNPLAAEFRHVNEELRLGHPVRDALMGIFHRTGIEDLRFFIVAVTLNREIGGNLSEIVGAVGATLRERFKLKAQVRSLTAQGRMSAMVLTGLAPFLYVAIQFLNPEYMEPLIATHTGHLVIGYCVGSVLFGYWLMRKIVDIKVIRTD